MVITFLIISLLMLAVWLDQELEQKSCPVLGEEWDFVTPNSRRKC